MAVSENSGSGFRVSGFRVLGFGGLGFRGLGPQKKTQKYEVP